RRQQQQLNAQMRRFAEVTMKILGGADATAIAPEVAAAIADTTSFSRVMVSISNGGPGLEFAGHAGLAEEAVSAEKRTLAEISLFQLQSLCASAESIGGKSFRLPAQSIKCDGDR